MAQSSPIPEPQTAKPKKEGDWKRNPEVTNRMMDSSHVFLTGWQQSLPDGKQPTLEELGRDLPNPVIREGVEFIDNLLRSQTDPKKGHKEIIKRLKLALRSARTAWANALSEKPGKDEEPIKLDETTRKLREMSAPPEVVLFHAMQYFGTASIRVSPDAPPNVS